MGPDRVADVGAVFEDGQVAIPRVAWEGSLVMDECPAAAERRLRRRVARMEPTEEPTVFSHLSFLLFTLTGREHARRPTKLLIPSTLPPAPFTAQ